MKLDEFLNYVYGHTYPGNIDLVCDGHENPEAYLAPQYANFETYAKETFGELKNAKIDESQVYEHKIHLSQDREEEYLKMLNLKDQS